MDTLKSIFLKPSPKNQMHAFVTKARAATIVAYLAQKTTPITVVQEHNSPPFTSDRTPRESPTPNTR
jgi:hypothetical protein